jgi:beta-N-acetylhexosaminidase
MHVRVGELFMLGFRGTSPPTWLVDFETRFGLGGVVLFDRDLEQGGRRNVESPEQLRSLCAALHALPSRPLVCVDQEGGRVRRLKAERGFRELPSAEAFARLAPEEAQRLAEASFAEMALLGIDIDLAPVVDLNTNPENPNIGAIERSFSDDPDEVRRCVSIVDAAARRAGVQLCLKHYPGLGGAGTDSHLALTDVTGSVSRAQLRLFTELCASTAGSAILLSHGIDRERDPDWPASVSATVIGELRRDLPDALLVTDDLQMQGLRQICSTQEASLRALRAGVDLVCIGNNLVAEQSECVETAEMLAELAASDAEFAATAAAGSARVRQRKDAGGPQVGAA